MEKRCTDNARPPVLLIHGGAGSAESDAELNRKRHDFISDLAESMWSELARGLAAVDAATETVKRLEASGLFNAGYGSALQSDGLARLSASLMDGERMKFSGVMLATHLIHPIELARALQNRTESVLGPLGAQLLARELGMAPQSPVSPARARRWFEYLEGRNAPSSGTGTVGAVVLDSRGGLAAATSTGGGRFNFPERVSDSATVAGNYASAHAAVSCTGIGEQIVDDGVAVRLETRVRDGRSLVEAADAIYREALERNREYGWIAVDRSGAWSMYWTTETMLCAAISADRPSPVPGGV
ncbi:beta-aspartyl-peptidase [Methylocaldum marinum]|uniref:Beta-aspartyl-peptidase n=1 Tax=Methylocaldum marinum TaxID=1432792 RepID=A0A250KNF7_9GAMM|nr:isoaspartyl peptidase/L-asparaginase [Methylocaldum marinum]BBA32491.1 beta-aspartyl-peptidase [Methylocaldum marinum]